MTRSFDDLVAEAAAVDVSGWDFSWLSGRATEQRPPWGYQRLLGRRLAAAARNRKAGTRGILRWRPTQPARPGSRSPRCEWSGCASRVLVEAHKPQ
jgi:hypothetical protein